MSKKLHLFFSHRLILQDLKQHGPSTRDEICKRTNMSLIWEHLNDLCHHGYLKPDPSGEEVTYALKKKCKGLWFLKGIAEVQK